MAARKIFKWLALLALALWFLVGCADGVIFQKVSDDGSVDRLRIDRTQGWGDYDSTPRDRNDKRKDGYGLMMKTESDF